MINSSRRRDSAGKLGDASGNSPVKHGNDDELVQDAGRSAVEDGNEDGAADGRPDVSDDESDAGQGQEVEVLLELLDVSRGVDGGLLIRDGLEDGDVIIPLGGAVPLGR